MENEDVKCNPDFKVMEMHSSFGGDMTKLMTIDYLAIEQQAEDVKAALTEIVHAGLDREKCILDCQKDERLTGDADNCNADKRSCSSVWSVRQKLEDMYKRTLLADLEYALDKKVEQDLWNFAFKNLINALQSQLLDKQNQNRSQVQTNLTIFLEAASGFYLQFLQLLCSTFKLDLPFRRKPSSFGVMNEKSPLLSEVNTPKSSSCLYICQYCLVHLGDIARYRQQVDQAQVYYRHAVNVSPQNGQPYNQLAILEVNRNNKLASVFYYIRSLSVRHPFPVAATNLEKFYAKMIRDKSEFRGKMAQNEFVNAFLQFQALLHLSADMERAAYLRNHILTCLPTQLSNGTFCAGALVQCVAITIFTFHHLYHYPHTGSGGNIGSHLASEMLDEGTLDSTRCPNADGSSPTVTNRLAVSTFPVGEIGHPFSCSSTTGASDTAGTIAEDVCGINVSASHSTSGGNAMNCDCRSPLPDDVKDVSRCSGRADSVTRGNAYSSAAMSTEERIGVDIILGFTASVLDQLMESVPPDGKRSECTSLPAVRVLLYWLLHCPSVIRSAPFAESRIWSHLAGLLNAIQRNGELDTAVCLEKYDTAPLPEDTQLQGFQPLETAHSEYDFTQRPLDGMSSAVEDNVRCCRLMELARAISVAYPQLCLSTTTAAGDVPVLFSSLALSSGDEGSLPGDQSTQAGDNSVCNNCQKYPTRVTTSEPQFLKVVHGGPSTGGTGISELQEQHQTSPGLSTNHHASLASSIFSPPQLSGCRRQVSLSSDLGHERGCLSPVSATKFIQNQHVNSPVTTLKPNITNALPRTCSGVSRCPNTMSNQSAASIFKTKIQTTTHMQQGVTAMAAMASCQPHAGRTLKACNYVDLAHHFSEESKVDNCNVANAFLSHDIGFGHGRSSVHREPVLSIDKSLLQGYADVGLGKQSGNDNTTSGTVFRELISSSSISVHTCTSPFYSRSAELPYGEAAHTLNPEMMSALHLAGEMSHNRDQIVFGQHQRQCLLPEGTQKGIGDVASSLAQMTVRPQTFIHTQQSMPFRSPINANQPLASSFRAFSSASPWMVNVPQKPVMAGQCGPHTHYPSSQNLTYRFMAPGTALFHHHSVRSPAQRFCQVDASPLLKGTQEFLDYKEQEFPALSCLAIQPPKSPSDIRISSTFQGHAEGTPKPNVNVSSALGRSNMSDPTFPCLHIPTTIVPSRGEYSLFASSSPWSDTLHTERHDNSNSSCPYSGGGSGVPYGALSASMLSRNGQNILMPQAAGCLENQVCRIHGSEVQPATCDFDDE